MTQEQAQNAQEFVEPVRPVVTGGNDFALTQDDLALALGRKDLSILALTKQLAVQRQLNAELAHHLRAQPDDPTSVF